MDTDETKSSFKGQQSEGPPSNDDSQQTHTVNIGQVGAANASPTPVPTGYKSEYMTCSNCNEQMWTKVKYKANTFTHTLAAILFCLVLIPFIWVPYCMPSCKTALHYCTKCNHFLGEYE